jgi:hypothetical protein
MSQTYKAISSSDNVLMMLVKADIDKSRKMAFQYIDSVIDLKSSGLVTALLEDCKRQPMKDVIYTLNVPKEYKCVTTSCGFKWTIGTAARVEFLRLLRMLAVPTYYGAKETSVMLACVTGSATIAMSCLKQVEDHNIRDMLLAFLLPTCRVAYDSEYNFYISAQALHTFFTGTYFVPNYYRPREFTKDDIVSPPPLFSDMCRRSTQNPLEDGEIINLFIGIHERIQKQAVRGYTAIYIDSAEPTTFFNTLSIT